MKTALWKGLLFWGILLGMFCYATAADLYWVTGSEALSITSTPSGLTQSKVYNSTTNNEISNFAFMVIEGTNIRYTLDGTTPSATVGIPVGTNGSVTLWWGELRTFKAYSAATATAYVTYKKYFPTN